MWHSCWQTITRRLVSEQQEADETIGHWRGYHGTVIPSALYERLLRTAAFYPKRLDE